MTNKQTYRWTESSIFFAFQKHLNTQEVGGGVSYKFLYKKWKLFAFQINSGFNSSWNWRELFGKSQKCS